MKNTARTRRIGRYTPPARRTRTAIVSTGLGLLALTQASPALAAEGSTVDWAPVQSDRRVQDDARLSGTVGLVAKVSTDHPVDGWSLAVLDDAGQPAFGTVCQKSFRRPQEEFRVDCPWNTVRDAEGNLSANRRYLVRLSTLVGETQTPAGPDRPVGVANPAAAPSDVTVSFDRSGRQVRLTWAPNREPDIIRYDVEEKTQGEDWRRVGTPTGTTFERTTTEPGEPKYRVAAERRGPDGQSMGSGPWTQPRTPERGSGNASKKTGSESPRENRGQNPPRESTSPNRDRSAGAPPPPNNQEGRTGAQPRNPERGSGSASKKTGSESPREHRGQNPPRESTSPNRDRSAGAPPPPNNQAGRTGSQPGEPARPRADRPPAAPPRAEGHPAAPPAARPPAAAARPADPPPAQRSPVLFSASSGDAFAALQRPPASSRTATALSVPGRPMDSAARDSGFQADLPYAARPLAEDAADADPGTGTVPEAFSTVGSEPMTDSTAPPVVPGADARRHNHRPAGAGLLVVAGGLLATAIRPIPRRRSRRPGPATVAATPPPEEVQASTEPMAADPAAYIVELEERLGQLESLLSTDGTPAKAAAARSTTEPTWYAELF